MSKVKDILHDIRTRKPVLLTRREVIELWKKQNDKMLDTYTCPSCRDLMYETEKSYYCKNMECGNFGREYFKAGGKDMKKEQKRTSEEVEDKDKPASTGGNQEKVKRQG